MIVTRETHLVRSKFNSNRVAEHDGTGRFLDPHTLEITSPGGRTTTVRGDFVLIACGTRPAQSASIPVDGKHIVDTDRLPELSDLPREMIIIGGGIISLEYASIFSAPQDQGALVEERPQLLSFLH